MSMDREAKTVDGLTKGIPSGAAAIELAEIGNKGWNLLRGDLPLPSAILVKSALLHNSRWMQRYIDQSGALFSPHGKTTICPQLFEMQIQSGAWGITAATMQQVRVYRAHGIKRVLLANKD